jgi:thiol-disulfide isomerase/thioredoxin
MKRLLAALSFALLPLLAHAATPFDRLTDLDGKPARLDDSKASRLVVFWGTWCDECRAKLGKELLELNQRPDVSVVTVNADRDDERVKAFVAKEGIRLPVLRDPSKELRRELKVFSVPHWALYRKHGAGYELAATEAAFDYDHVLKAITEGAHP